MDDRYAYFAYCIIFLLFFSGITYYVILFVIARKLKKENAGLWSDYRGHAKIFESEFLTAYKIVVRNKNTSNIELSTNINQLAKMALCNLYVSMTLFMLVLFFGLYLSVNK